MKKITTAKTAATLAECIELVQRTDEQWHVYASAGDIGEIVSRVQQPDNAPPVAILISPRRYAWLNAMAADVPPEERLTRIAAFDAEYYTPPAKKRKAQPAT